MSVSASNMINTKYVMVPREYALATLMAIVLLGGVCLIVALTNSGSSTGSPDPSMRPDIQKYVLRLIVVVTLTHWLFGLCCHQHQWTVVFGNP